MKYSFSGAACPPLITVALLLCGSIAVADDDFTPLFPNNTLEGWVEEQHDFFIKDHPNTKTWKIEDGVVSCDGSQGNCGFLRYDRMLCDFVFKLEYRMSADCNSGVGIRAPGPYKGNDLTTLPSQSGFEVQILDDAGKKPDDKSSGAFYGQLAPTENAAKPAGEWNDLEIVCEGSQIRVVLNGKTVQDIDYAKIPALKDRPACGYLSLQNHGHNTDFRNVRLHEIHGPSK